MGRECSARVEVLSAKAQGDVTERFLSCLFLRNARCGTRSWGTLDTQSKQVSARMSLGTGTGAKRARWTEVSVVMGPCQEGPSSAR
eukprot:1102015-Pyramimonas_sp.AAC.1